MITCCWLLLGGLVLTACGDSPRQTEAGLLIATRPAGPAGVGDGALLTGTVAARNGCLTIRIEGDTYVLPVFDVLDKRPDRLVEGDRVEFAGGGGSRRPFSDVSVPAPCDQTDSYWLVVRDG